MADPWRFRPPPPPIQSNLCPICSTSHFPFCPPPPSFPYLAPAGDLHHRHFSPAFPPRDPNPIPPPPRFLQGDDFLDRDGFRKRMRVEDPNPLPPPMPQQQPRMTSFEVERRLSLIREHGQQNTAPLSDHRFDYVSQANSFDGHRKFQEFSRPESVDGVLLPERRDFYGGEVESLRNRGEEKYIDRGSDERPFGEFRPSLSRDREFYLNESSSYRLPKQPQYPHSENGHMMHLPKEPQYPLSGSDHMMPFPKQPQHPHSEMPCAKQPEYPQSESNHMMPLPKQPQYPHPESYQEMPRTGTDEQGSQHPPRYPDYGPPLENKFEFRNEQIIHFAPKPYVNSVSHESNDYRMDSTLPGRVHSSLHYPPLPPHPPLPPPPEPSPPRKFQDKPLIRSPPPLLSPMPSTNSKPLFPTPPTSRNTLESRPAVQSKFYAETVGHTTGFVTEALGFIHQKPSKEYMERRGQTFPNRRPVKDEPTVIDACQLFKQPHRASRPDRIVVILRGLPGFLLFGILLIFYPVFSTDCQSSML